MNKLKLVKLTNEKPYKKYNLKKDIHGVVLKDNLNNLETIFFNSNNVGEYVLVIVEKKDIAFEKEEIPVELEKELNSKLESIKSNAKLQFSPKIFNDYDNVELITERDSYAKLGIHKGSTGCVMNSKAVQNYIEVDFSGIDNNGNYYGDCISVKIEDLKVIK